MTDAAHARPSRRRPFGFLAGVVAVGVALWTGAWFFIRAEIGRQVDATLAALAERGVVVDCPDRGIGGWPFRIEVTCAAPTLSFADGRGDLRLAGLGVSALVYRPNHVIAELVGPASLRRTAVGAVPADVDADWESLRFSLNLDKGRLGRFSLETRRLAATVRRNAMPDQTLRLASGEVHLAKAGLAGGPAIAALGPTGPAPVTTGATGTPPPPNTALPAAVAADVAASDDDLRLALHLRGAELPRGGAGLLTDATGPAGSAARPAAAELPPVDLDVDAGTVGLPPQPIGLRDLAEAGTRLDIVAYRAQVGDLAVEGAGRFGLAADGSIEGVLETQPQPATATRPAPAAMKAALAGAVMMFGTSEPSRSGRVGRRLDVVIRDGVVRVGRMTLAHLKPLF
jgi:hypothetical protein